MCLYLSLLRFHRRLSLHFPSFARKKKKENEGEKKENEGEKRKWGKKENECVFACVLMFHRRCAFIFLPFFFLVGFGGVLGDIFSSSPLFFSTKFPCDSLSP